MDFFYLKMTLGCRLTKRSIPLKIARPFFLIYYIRFHREFLTSNKTELVYNVLYTSKISSRLLTMPPKCLSLQWCCLSVCLSPLASLCASKLPFTSRVLSVCLIAVPHLLLFHFNSMSHHLESAIFYVSRATLHHF